MERLVALFPHHGMRCPIAMLFVEESWLFVGLVIHYQQQEGGKRDSMGLQLASPKRYKQRTILHEST